MAKDLVKKKPVALDPDTYGRLSKLAAQLRIDNPGGGFVSMSEAVGVLLDTFGGIDRLRTEREAWIKDNPKSTASFVIEPGDEGGFQLWRIENDYGDSFWVELNKPVSLQSYAANAEANDPEFLEPENE